MSRFFFILVIACLLYGRAAQAQAQIVVVVNKSNPITSVSTSDLKSMFTGDLTKFPSGSSVTLVTYKSDTETRKKFYQALGKKYNECQALLLKRMLNDGLKPPASFESDEDVVNYVAKTPGAIGVVSAALVSGSVKTITVDGKKQID
jgi:ABC-type phosphate transport system substrate-binding protein